MTRWVVIGGGSAGSVVAARLSETNANDVVLVEAGPDHGVSDDAVGPSLDHPARLRTGVGVVRRPGDVPVPYAQGNGLGGSSLVNGSLVVGDLEEWALGHELPIAPARPLGPVGLAVLAATDDASPVGLIGRGGRRVTVADAYLRPVRDRANLRVLTDTIVDRIIVEGRRAVGVVAGGDQVDADRVVVCAGAIESPALLLRSNIDTPGVGVGLQDHVGVAFSFDLNDPEADVVPIGVTIERPGRQIVVIDRLADRTSMGAFLAGHLDVVSRGSVSVDDDGRTVTMLNQLHDRSDLEGVALVAREALRLLAEPALRDAIGEVYLDDHGTPLSAVTDDEAMRRWIPDHLGGYHHLAGSCRLALDDRGTLIGYDGIAVCDASALRGAPPRNPYLTVVRLAESMTRRWMSG